MLSTVGCYSLAETRHPQFVRCENGDVLLGLWIDERGWFDDRGLPRRRYPQHLGILPTVDGFTPVDGLLALLSWPLDAVASTYWAVRAPFDSEYSIQAGPLGALCGIALPGITLMPGFMNQPIPEATLSPSDKRRLLSGIRSGRAVEAYSETVGPALWKSTNLPLADVEILAEPTTARLR